MKTMVITQKDIAKARKANPTIIPASERPWSRPTLYIILYIQKFSS